MRLQRIGLESARQEVEWLLGHLLGVSRLELYLLDDPVPSAIIGRFWAILDERANGVPLQYLLEHVEFFGATLTIAPGVFIPRPETETILEVMVDRLRALEDERRRPLQLLDLGTGSGCLAVTLGRCLPTCVVVGVELSWAALRIARLNVQRHGLSGRIQLVQGDWLQPIRGTFDGIIANPPYIPSAQVDDLPLDVRHEPRVSLDGGVDGLDALWHVIGQAAHVLKPGGVLVLECGEEQVEGVAGNLRTAPWVGQVMPLHDLTGRPRGIFARRQTGAGAHG